MQAKFKRHLLQSTLATLCSLLVFLLLHRMHWPLVTSTSVASTAFVLFALPENESAKAWNTIGGNAFGLASGLLVVALGQVWPMPEAMSFALTVGLALWTMLMLRAPHPPAAGAALTVPHEALRDGFTFEMGGAIMLSVIALLLLQRLLLRWLISRPAAD